MQNDEHNENNNHLVIHYLTLRQILGWMGLLLPIVLFTGSAVLYESGPEASISNYFYTTLRDVFIVTLCAVSLFLLAYKGYGKADLWVSNIAGIFGLIAAFVHTNPKPGINYVKQWLVRPELENNEFVQVSMDCVQKPYESIPVPQHHILGVIHLVCAAIFFLCLAYIAYFEFTKSTGPLTPQKIWRNRIYKFCGAGMLVCILALVPCFVSDELQAWYNAHKLIFWGESIALILFGTSWLIKGEFVLKDK
jgi:hypothetical protein